MLGLIFILLSVSSASLTILAVIALVLYTASYALGVEPSALKLIVLTSALMLVPAASYLAASLLDRFTFGSQAPPILKPLALVFSLLFVFQGFMLADLLTAFLSGLTEQSLSSFIVAAKAAALAGAGVAVVYMVAVLFFEIPAMWLLGAAGIKGDVVFRSLRPIAILLLLTISTHIALDFILHSLSI